MENENTCHCCKKKDRSDKERKDLMNRLSRIEGQIRGIKGMVEKDCYCPDIITQVAVNFFAEPFLGVTLTKYP